MTLFHPFRTLWRRLRGRPAAEVDFAPWRERLGGTLSEEAFTALMAEVLAQLAGVRSVRVVEPLLLEVRTKRLEHTCSLAVPYSELPAGADAREASLRFFLGSMEEALAGDRRGPRTVDVQAIVPLLWSRAALEESPLEYLVQEPFVADLHVVYAIDQPHSFSYLLPEEREQLGLEGAALRETAVANLTRL
ncbi:MAG: hypothetical protein L0Y64_12080, partial [Myxococcaceae bacterium]|nr:hypothetical protein [Myxococcaceae bacterium]